MQVTAPLPLLRRLPPGVWAVVAWCAGLAFTFLMRVRLPGEIEPAVSPGVLIYRWDGLASLAIATALAVTGGVRLRTGPLPALVLLLAAAVVACVPLGVAEIPAAQFLAVDAALYFIASSATRRRAIAALAMSLTVLAGYLVTRLHFGWGVGTSAELAVAMTAVIAWLVGRSAHQAHEHAESLRVQAAAQAITGERLRIARELHDMVAHSISIIALQAGAARRVIDTQPVRAREALGEIETVGRETLSGLRRMVGTLRHPDSDHARRPATGSLDPRDACQSATGPSDPYDGRRAANAGEPDSVLAVREVRSGEAGPVAGSWLDRGRGQGAGEPEPGVWPGLDPVVGLGGLADVERLAATTTAAGVEVQVRWLGDRRPLPPEIDVSAYRIIQEALTNVVRHSSIPSCQVSVDFAGDEVIVEVLDPAPGPASDPASTSDLASASDHAPMLQSGSMPDHALMPDRAPMPDHAPRPMAASAAAYGAGGDRGIGHGSRSSGRRRGGGRKAADHTARAGYGLAGMGERVALLNGAFSAGPRRGGGFRVLARLPVPGPVP
ncbi:sensor histidine kinase [Nonomuraea phyllanthi]|uniref:sensor histidine kinase n=1 Tax=Nonomuraea phyllanthi TaxID=2219224 RepID=UPI001D025EDF|nr:histidine kinase [Nonomuraea phyllanthi]